MEFLKGIRIYNYRSIDNEGVELNDFGKVNVLIGKNNSGKSNIIRFISLLKDLTTQKSGNAIISWLKDSTNYFNNEDSTLVNFSIRINPFSLKDITSQRTAQDNFLINHLKKEANIWMNYNISTHKAVLTNDIEGYTHKNIFNADIITLQEQLKHDHGTNFDESRMKEFVNGFYKFNTETFFVGNYRKIDLPTSGSSPFDVDENSRIFNGTEVIGQIKRIKSPSPNEHYLQNKFFAFQQFVRDILNNPILEVDVTYNNKLTIKMGRESYSIRNIENLGTGVHQIIILAFAATYNENCIFCIEEPEIFIHPEVQRKFIRYLVERTNNQYFITTHSNAFINEDKIDIYRVWQDKGSTKAIKAIDSNSKNSILDDLGYQASDLLQTNFIIWVEGPSDRIYIRHWINIESNNKLIEGIHYTIMFYGGRLLSHLSIEDDEVSSFININKINRNATIFIDSDKGKFDDTINATKERIITEFANQGKQNILTEGREIENYIDNKTLNKALSNINRPKLKEYDLFTDIFIEKNIDKMKLAKTVVDISNEIFDVGNLKADIKYLVEAISKANNLAL